MAESEKTSLEFRWKMRKSFLAKTFIGRRTKKSVGLAKYVQRIDIRHKHISKFIFSFKTFNFVKDFSIKLVRLNYFNF